MTSKITFPFHLNHLSQNQPQLLNLSIIWVQVILPRCIKMVPRQLNHTSPIFSHFPLMNNSDLNSLMTTLSTSLSNSKPSPLVPLSSMSMPLRSQVLKRFTLVISLPLQRLQEASTVIKFCSSSIKTQRKMLQCTPNGKTHSIQAVCKLQPVTVAHSSNSNN